MTCVSSLRWHVCTKPLFSEFSLILRKSLKPLRKGQKTPTPTPGHRQRLTASLEDIETKCSFLCPKQEPGSLPLGRGRKLSPNKDTLKDLQQNLAASGGGGNPETPPECTDIHSLPKTEARLGEMRTSPRSHPRSCTRYKQR